MKTHVTLFILILTMSNIVHADFDKIKTVFLGAVGNPAGVTVNPFDGHYWFINYYYNSNNYLNEMDSEFRSISEIRLQPTGPTGPSGVMNFYSVAYDVNDNSFWVSDYMSLYVREYNTNGDLISNFNISPNLWEYKLTYDYKDDSIWIPEEYGGVLFEYSKAGTLLKTLELYNLTTPVAALDLAYDSNRDVLWLKSWSTSSKLVKLSKDGVILGMYNWDISQIKYFSGMGYDPINDQILITESYDYYNQYLYLWIYSSSGDFIGNQILNPYGDYTKGLHVSGNHVWVVSSLDDEGSPYGIAKMDMTGKLISFYSTHYWEANITGILELPSSNSLWITQRPDIAIPMMNHKIQDLYYNFLRLSPSCEILDSYSYLPYNTDFQGITHDETGGNLWIVDSSLDQVLEFTTSGTLISSFPIAQKGCTEPRGITYDPASDRLLIIDDATDSVYCFTKTGQFKWSCSISNITTSPEDISYEAPGIIWILEGQRAIRCFYEPPTSVVPTHWDGYY